MSDGQKLMLVTQSLDHVERMSGLVSGGRVEEIRQAYELSWPETRPGRRASSRLKFAFLITIADILAARMSIRHAYIA